MKLHTKIFIGLIAGIIVGIIVGPSIAIIKPIGDLFIRMIRMIIVPLVLSSLVVGAASIGDIKTLGRIGGKTIGFYLVTTALAVIIGLILGNILMPGVGLELKVENPEVKDVTPPTIGETLINLVPKNPVAAMANGDMLQIIVFALFLGIAMTLVGDKGKTVLDFFDSFAEIMYKLTGVIMQFAPYAVFALIAPIVGKYGLSVIMPLIKVILAVYVGCILHWIIVYSPMVRIFGKMNPITFFRNIAPAQLYAFSTCSSSGTLPLTMECARENNRVSNKIASFVLPLGATINMDGTALYQGVCALFIAQVYGIDLSLGQQLTIVLTATLASIGTAGVPGAGLIMLTLALKSVGLPLEGLALVAGIDRILDMMRTCTNITGDSAVAVAVAATEGELGVEEAEVQKQSSIGA